MVPRRRYSGMVKKHSGEAHHWGEAGRPTFSNSFYLVLDDWLSSLDPEIGFASRVFKVDVMAFADDLVVMASTPQGLQETGQLRSLLRPART